MQENIKENTGSTIKTAALSLLIFCELQAFWLILGISYWKEVDHTFQKAGLPPRALKTLTFGPRALFISALLVCISVCFVVFYARWTRSRAISPQVSHPLRWLTELLLSLNLAVLMVWMTADSKLLSRLQGLFVYFQYWRHGRLDGLAYARSDFADAYRVAYFLLVVLWTVTILLALRLLARFSFARVIPRVLAVVLGIAACALAQLRVNPGLPVIYEYEILGAVVVVCFLLYKYRRRPVLLPLMALVFLLHFGLWIWVSWASQSPTWVFALDNVGWIQKIEFPLLGICSVLAWALYLRQFDSQQHDDSVARV